MSLRINKLLLKMLLIMSSFCSNVEAGQRAEQPNSNITIVPFKSLFQSEKEYKEALKESEQYQKNGFVYEENNFPKTLISIGENKFKYLASPEQEKNPADTHLKRHIENVPLAFKYRAPKLPEDSEIIGFSALDSWQNIGWTGVNQTFKHKNLGICRLDVTNLKLTGG